MNREAKAAVVDEVAAQIEAADAVFAVDYRGISVPQAAELRTRLNEAGAGFRVVKNTLTNLAADKAGADELKALLEGPTAFTFVPEGGDVALAAKALATFRREHDVLSFKGGRMNGDALSAEELEALSRLPAPRGAARAAGGRARLAADRPGPRPERPRVRTGGGPGPDRRAGPGGRRRPRARGCPRAGARGRGGARARGRAAEETTSEEPEAEAEPEAGSDDNEPTDAPAEGATTDSEEA